MELFQDLNLNKFLLQSLEEMGLEHPTPVQSEAFSVIKSGKSVLGVSQTGTGKTIAYLLPLLEKLKFARIPHPRILILVPTRELVLQVQEEVEKLSAYQNLRVQGVYGGTNINTQALELESGADVLVATPGRLYDLALNGALKLKHVLSLVIDEVDVMLDLGFRFQLGNIFELLPEKRQNIMFSATMTEEIEDLIDDYFTAPHRISISPSGKPLENIRQTAYALPNFHTKANLLAHLIKDEEAYSKVLVFVSSKKMADRLYDTLTEKRIKALGIIHSNKSQNARIQAIEGFEEGSQRVLIATDVMARGLDLQSISHVFNCDTPVYPENYIHRIGRTGRAKMEGEAILFYTEMEEESKLAIEILMNKEIEILDLPEEVEISSKLIPEERISTLKNKNPHRNRKDDSPGQAFHEKKEKNQKVNQGGSYHREIAIKYTKPKTRGDKNQRKRRT